MAGKYDPATWASFTDQQRYDYWLAGFQWKGANGDICNYQCGEGAVYFVLDPPTCVPAWVCETPLNGYEKDGCGNRRFHARCESGTQPPGKEDNKAILIIIGLAIVYFALRGK